MRIQINELRIQWKKLEKELQSKFLEIQKKELNTNSKISEWENRAGGEANIQHSESKTRYSHR